jgi:hypothetical protein
MTDPSTPDLVDVLWTAVTMGFLVGGVTYVWARFFRKE